MAIETQWKPRPDRFGIACLISYHNFPLQDMHVANDLLFVLLSRRKANAIRVLILRIVYSIPILLPLIAKIQKTTFWNQNDIVTLKSVQCRYTIEIRKNPQ